MAKKTSSTKKTSTRKTISRKPRVSAGIKKYVKAAIHREIEDKNSLLVQNVVTVSPYSQNTNMVSATCLPTINMSQGVGQSGRIGNTVRTRRLTFSFILYPNPYDILLNSVPKPQDVLIFLGKIKGQKDRQPVASDFTKLWQNGNTSVVPYSDLRDMTAEVNRDYFTVYKIMRFKVCHSSIGGSGSTASNQFFANNDYKYNVIRKMNITKYCPKILKFNDTTLSPVNDNLWIWATCVNADGSSSTNPYPMTMSYSFHYVYEDA